MMTHKNRQGSGSKSIVMALKKRIFEQSSNKDIPQSVSV